jgi:hypothetical protein
MTRYTVTLNDELGPLNMNATRAKFAGGVSAFGSRAGHLLIQTTATTRFTAIHNNSGRLQDPQARCGYDATAGGTVDVTMRAIRECDASEGS